MITYGFSQQGRSHVDKGVVCQDYHKIMWLKNGWCVLVIADGVGSARYSDEGSRIATEALAEYCKEHMAFDMDDEQIIALLQRAYSKAFLKVQQYCDKVEGNIEDYDTTLTTAIYTGQDVYYGHAGDGGIIVRDFGGNYEMVTTPQKGIDGISVRPLRAGADSWEFGKVNKKVIAVLLATDGMLDTLMPPLLNIEKINMNPLVNASKQMNVYVTLAEFLMNPDSIYRNKEIDNPEQFLKLFLDDKIKNDQFNQCLSNAYNNMFDSNTALAICRTVSRYNYSTWKIGKVTDDRTIVCAMNEIRKGDNADPEYYAEPDWKALQNRFDRLAYPSLYEEKIVDTTEHYAKVDLAAEKSSKSVDVVKSGTERKINNETAVSSRVEPSVYSKYNSSKRGINVLVIFIAALLLAGAFQGVRIVHNRHIVEQEKVSKHDRKNKREREAAESTQQLVKGKKAQEVCFYLMGKQYAFPCKLDDLMREYPELQELTPGVYICFLSDKGMKIRVEVHESETKNIQVQSVQFELTEVEGKDQNKYSWKADTAVQIRGISVAELGMKPFDIDENQEDLHKYNIVGQKNGVDYLFSYNTVSCIISVENGLVKKILLTNSEDSSAYASQ